MSRTIQKLLVATDLTADGDSAVAVARSWAERLSGSLVVAHALPEGSRSDMLFPQQHLTDVAEALSIRRTVGEELESRLQPGEELAIVEGKAGEVLLGTAKARGSDLVVLGGREPSGKRVFGSVAEYVLTHSDVPVLIARRHANTARIVLAIDVNDDYDAPLEYALSLADKPFCGQLVVVHSPKEKQPVDRETSLVLKQIRRRLPRSGEFVIEPGDAPGAIVAVAERTDAELIVIGTNNRKGLARFVIGSVASAVARRASCSVLVVPLPKE